MLHELLRQRLVSRRVIMELDEQHPLARVGVAEHEVTQQSFLRAHVVERHAYLLGIALDLIANLVVKVIHEPALTNGVDLIEGTRDMEADGSVVAIFEIEVLVGKFFLCEPPTVTATKLEFVAIGCGLDRAKDRRDRRQVDLADTRQLIKDLLLLGFKLLLIGQILPFAAAADAEMLAERLRTHLALLDKVDDTSFSIFVFLTVNLDIHNIAGNAEWHEDHTVVVMEKTFAFSSYGFDGDSFKNRIGFVLSAHVFAWFRCRGRP